MKISFRRNQLELVVHTMILSFQSFVTTRFDGLYNDRRNEKEWKKHPPNKQPITVKLEQVADQLWTLGWNLSIFYANVTDDGMGEADALGLNDLQGTLNKWAADWIRGRIGYDDEGNCQSFDAKTLAKEWVHRAFYCDIQPSKAIDQLCDQLSETPRETIDKLCQKLSEKQPMTFREFRDKLENNYYSQKGVASDVFYHDLCEHYGVDPTHPGVVAAYNAAYEIGHSSGHQEVNCHFPDMLEIVFSTEKAASKAKINPNCPRDNPEVDLPANW